MPLVPQQFEGDDGSAHPVEFEYLVSQRALRPEDVLIMEGDEHLAALAVGQVGQFDTNPVPLVASSAVLLGT